MMRRKNFVRFLVAAGVLTTMAACQAENAVTFVQGKDRIDVKIQGKPVATYRYEDKLTKPVLFPVLSPSGVAVTRGYPLETVAGESTDHPHHVGLFFTYDEVNDEGFWAATKSPPQIRHVKVTEMKEGDGQGELSTVMHWVAKNGDVLLEENRTMIFTAEPDAYAIDFAIELTAKGKSVVFEDTKEGMFGIRVAGWLKEKEGSGKYLSSEGKRGEKDIWGRRAEWVCLQGKKDQQTIGVAIFNHPASVNYPTYWHARGYGLFAANPLGQHVFDTSNGKANAEHFRLTLDPGESALFLFRVLIYQGPKTAAQLERDFAKFKKSQIAKGAASL